MEHAFGFVKGIETFHHSHVLDLPSFAFSFIIILKKNKPPFCTFVGEDVFQWAYLIFDLMPLVLTLKLVEALQAGLPLYLCKGYEV